MADDKDKEVEKANAKLKELERTLAKELDQQVKLAEPSDPRLDGTVALNPTLDVTQAKPKTPTPPTANQSGIAYMPQQNTTISGASGNVTVIPGESGSGVNAPTGVKKVDDISLQDVDDILNQLDSTFQASMEEIKNEVSKIEAPQNLESISISADYLKGDDKEEGITEPVAEKLNTTIEDALAEDEEALPVLPGNTLLDMMMRFLKATVLLPVDLSRQLVRELLLMRTIPPKDVLMAIPAALLPFLQRWVEILKEFFDKLRSYSLFTYLKFIAFIALVCVFGFLVRDILFNTRSDEVKDPFLRSFSDVAGEIQLLPEDDTGEDLESPLKHPEYTVLIPRITANLKPPSPRYSPMIVFELYLEASNQECAVEIHDREVEIKDLIARITEQITFDEIESAQGKVRFKVRLRAGLNKILNKGRVRRIFFKSLNIQK